MSIAETSIKRIILILAAVAMVMVMLFPLSALLLFAALYLFALLSLFSNRISNVFAAIKTTIQKLE